MPLVSLVTPVYNGEQYLAPCIESVLSQSFTDYEYIIVDNCSSDRTSEIAARYARDERVRIYRNDTLIPVIANYNRGASLTSPGSRYIKYCASDDLLLPDCLKKMVALAEDHPTVEVVASYKLHGDAVVTDGPRFPEEIVDGRTICRWFFEGKLGVLGGPTNHLIRLPGPAMRCKLFDEEFLHADIECFVRMLKHGADYGFVHQVLTFTREHKASVSSRFADVMGTRRSEFLAILLRHGLQFASPHEFAMLEAIHRRAYARWLWRVWLKPWDRAIWRYQTEIRRRLDIDVGWTEIVTGGLREFAAAVGSPATTVRRLRREYARVTAGRPDKTERPI